MKKWIYALIVPLVLVAVLVFARGGSNHEKSNPDVAKSRTTGNGQFVFKSTDGGQTWEDISKGLPGGLWDDNTRDSRFFANNKGLYARLGNELYYSSVDASASFWTKEGCTVQSCIATGKPGKFYWGVQLETRKGTSVWSPIFGDDSEPRIRSVFETSGGTIFIGTDKGIFKTDNSGKTWKHVYAGGWAGHLAESNGVLVATSKKKIIRSTDNGENWTLASSEDGVAFDVKSFKGGFAAITIGSESTTRRLSTSYDGGKTWQSVHSRLQDKVVIDSIWRTWNDRPRVPAFQTSIIQVGDNFLCTHPDGIFISPDKGKTWQFLLPSIDDKGFNLLVTGNVIYAIRSRGGC